jgi:hypothetical protein
MNRATPRRLASTGILTAAVAILLAPAVEAKPRPKPKLPDLTVKTTPLEGQAYAVNGEAADRKTQFHLTVFNAGNKSTGRKTVVRVHLVHSIHGSYKLGYAEIPELKPKHGHAESVTTPITRAPAGAYKVRACVDLNQRIEESDEHNNCDNFKLNDIHYYVVNNSYTGRITGIEDQTSSGGWIESWDIKPQVTLGPVAAMGHGNFSYPLSGTVYYTDSGGSNGCTVTGSGVSSVLGTMQIHFEDDTYIGFGTSGASYPIFSSCSSTPDQGPVQPQVWDTEPSSEPQTLAFGNNIGGGVSDGVDTNWTWDLAGAD